MMMWHDDLSKPPTYGARSAKPGVKVKMLQISKTRGFKKWLTRLGGILDFMQILRE
jgi:hypothetical protein